MQRSTFLALAATGVLLAGCLSSSPTEPSSDDRVGAASRETYVVPEVPHVDAAELLRDHAEFVRANSDRRDNTEDHENARLAILERFASYGLETYRHDFVNDIPQANLIGIKWGIVRDQWVVVGGHYDIVNTPPCLPGVPQCQFQTEGAYDDASGTMMSVHLAKAFANTTPYYTMAFIAYDGEERGLNGASAFVRDFVTGDDGEYPTPYGRVKIIGALDLDMIGLNWPGVMAPINVLTNSELTYKVADEKRHEMDWPDAQWRRKDGLKLGSSDYARFWSVSEEDGGPIPTMFFIADFEEIGAPNAGGEVPAEAYTPFGAYPFWHLEDTVETMTAMAGGQANLESGFQAAADVAAHVLHAYACHPLYEFDAEVY
ncbi:MAG: hypothetical protein QOJ26_223 [Thermoplasmata archaeon]|jgi:hypothetical protein|nr:hypothetical protein [Thermoplasmata archaeon]MEA3165379.1 hypothetical protein [Thermoplasmata archaeon]